MIQRTDARWGSVISNLNGSQVELWLTKLMEGDGSPQEAIFGLSEELSHQLSWNRITAYVLPHLAAFVPNLSKKDQVYLIAQMGAAIAAEAECPLPLGTEAYQEFYEGLSGLQKEVKTMIADPQVQLLLAEDTELGVMFTLGALAVIGDRNHAYGFWLLSGSVWEEGMAACACGWDEESIPFLEQPDCIEEIQIDPWDGTSFEHEAVWLNGVLELVGDNPVSSILPLVYGTGVCPECGETEPYWDWLYRFHEGEAPSL